jgi:SAM-dependent methyltransferase
MNLNERTTLSEVTSTMEAGIVDRPDGPSGPPSRDPAQLRAHLHALWSSVAGGWAEHAAYIDTRAAAVTEAMLERTAPARGERVLELACGPGGLGLAAAERVAPDGEVVLSDVAPEMTAIAAARAAGRGLANTTTRELDLEAIDAPDGAFDVVLCREGLMFAADPARAAREIARVTRPDGRVAIAVWAPRQRNPWLGIVLDAVTAETGAPVPPPGIPGPFSLSDRDELARLLDAAGLAPARIEEVPVPLRAATFDEWWVRTTALSGPLAQRLAALPGDIADAIRTRTRAAVAPYTTPAGLELPGVTLLASARRA